MRWPKLDEGLDFLHVGGGVSALRKALDSGVVRDSSSVGGAVAGGGPVARGSGAPLAAGPAPSVATMDNSGSSGRHFSEEIRLCVRSEVMRR